MIVLFQSTTVKFQIHTADVRRSTIRSRSGVFFRVFPCGYTNQRLTPQKDIQSSRFLRRTVAESSSRKTQIYSIHTGQFPSALSKRFSIFRLFNHFTASLCDNFFIVSQQKSSPAGLSPAGRRMRGRGFLCFCSPCQMYIFCYNKRGNVDILFAPAPGEDCPVFKRCFTLPRRGDGAKQYRRFRFVSSIFLSEKGKEHQL